MFIIEESAVATIEAVSKRLYREDRLPGDQMRDLAQALRLVAEAARQPTARRSGATHRPSYRKTRTTIAMPR